jgi:hypothetical protein
MPLEPTQLVTSSEAHRQLDYLNTTAYWRAITAAWTYTTVPQPVQHAILAQLTAIYTHRGDSDGTNVFDENGLVKHAAALLNRYRDPVIA